ncbi:MAG: hypothetical protein GYA17_12200, partial [Chloroflexi bacterium]|nr:hypothetical protein [Chloroflexota bacterium]
MAPKRIFISADHGLAIVYFLQTDILPALLDAGVEVVLLTDDGLQEQITRRFGRPGLVVEGLRLKECRNYFDHVSPTAQWWLNFLRRVGAAGRINVEAMESHIRQVEAEAVGKRRALMPWMKAAVGVLRHSQPARRW